jgi:hypothetical protein
MQMAGKFKLINKIKFSDIQTDTILPESDLAIQNQDTLFQFKFKGKNKTQKKIVKPGTFMIKYDNGGAKLAEVELGKRRLLLDAVNSKSILEEANRFFGNLHVYEQLDRPKKRGALIYSSPGQGKSSTIAHFCNTALEEDAGTVIIVWPTSKVESDDVTDLLAVTSQFDKTCTRMVLILEDIGGAEYENNGGRRGVDSGILNLLDGVSLTFKLPTFIIATTNHPENLLASLADRPGRFDLMIELKPPSYQDRIKLLEFIAKRPLSDEEKHVFSSDECDNLSIAHLDEIVVRSMLHSKTLKQTLREILDHRKNVSDAFEKAKRSGIGFSVTKPDDDDF